MFPQAGSVVFDLDGRAAAPPRGGFDLVLCAHVLEHVSFPVPFLRRLRAFLRPRGLLYLEVPGPGRRPPGACVFDYMGTSMHEHVSFFSGRAVLRLLQRCGLEPVWTVTAREATQVFARRASSASRALPPPVRGPGGLDSLADPQAD